MNRGEKLKKLRSERGLTQKKVAEKLGIDKNTISKAEKNGNLSNTTIELFANFYNTSMDFLKIDDIENTTNTNIEINKIFGFSDITISNIKQVNEKKYLNILFEKLYFQTIAYDLKEVSLLKKYYNICKKIIDFHYKNIEKKEFYIFINSLNIEEFEDIYSIRSIIDNLKNIIYSIRDEKNHNEIKKFIVKLSDYMNRINEQIGYFKYDINKEIIRALDEIFENRYII